MMPFHQYIALIVDDLLQDKLLASYKVKIKYLGHQKITASVDDLLKEAKNRHSRFCILFANPIVEDKVINKPTKIIERFPTLLIFITGSNLQKENQDIRQGAFWELEIFGEQISAILTREWYNKIGTDIELTVRAEKVKGMQIRQLSFEFAGTEIYFPFHDYTDDYNLWKVRWTASQQ